MRILVEAVMLVNVLGGFAAMVTRHLLQKGPPAAFTRRRPALPAGGHREEQERLLRENAELDSALARLHAGDLDEAAARILAPPGGGATGPVRYAGPTGPGPSRLTAAGSTTLYGSTGPTGVTGATGPAAWFPLPDSEPAPLPPLDLDDESRLTGPRRRARRYRGPAA